MNAVTSLTPESANLTRADGSRFALRFFPGADPAAPLLLIQPAMGVQAGYYTPLALALNEAGYNAAVSELRGHEEASDARRPGWGYDFGYDEMLREDWPLAVAAARKRFPRSRLYLLGHSLGGQVSSIFAAHNPGAVDGLILIAISSVYWRLWGFGFLGYSQLTVLVSHLLGHFPGKVFRFAGREARTVIADWARQARTGRFRFGRPKVDHDALMAQAKLPVLGISLAGDFFAPRQAADHLLGKLKSADLTRLHLDPKAAGFEKVDHFRWVRQPNVVLPAIKEWLSARP